MSNDLRDLIVGTKGDRSYEQLSRDCGGVPTAKRLHQLATAQLKNFPDPPTIQGLARGMGVSVTEVVLASARSLELPVRDLGDVATIDPTGLTPEQADAVRHVVRAMRSPGQESPNAAPMKKAGRAGHENSNVHELQPPDPEEIEKAIREGRMAAHRTKGKQRRT